MPRMSEVKRTDIAAMFDRISGGYDLANRLLSLGFDREWRNRALCEAAPLPGERWLDIACGTGDMIEEGLCTEPGSYWYGLDPSFGMLKSMRERPRLAGVPRLVAASEALPLRSSSFDGVTIAFGLRNFEDRERGLREIARVLRPRGRLVILEFLPSEQRRWGFGTLTRLYLNRVLPRLGGWITGHRDAYEYLNQSSRAMWIASHLHDVLDSAGFTAVRMQPMMMGVVTLTSAVRA
ncbi:ubiquinone/menaquinone biosynthesis methyltransferase [bacterium]|nr:ubiquinone/menaquinone biosynthesis methyltransferase [bacterium]